MKLEVGKSYKNRRGEKVFICAYSKDGDYYRSSDGFCYYPDGSRYLSWTKTIHDLISEWVEPEMKKVDEVTVTNFMTQTDLFIQALRAFEAMPNTERKAALAYLNERFKGE